MSTPHSLRSGSLAAASGVAVTMGVVIALGASVMPATAAEPATVVIPTVGGSITETWDYLPTVIDPDAAALRVDSYTPAAGPTVDCTLNAYESVAATQSFAAADWNAPGPVVLALPAGAVQAGLANLVCQSTGVAASGGEAHWSIVWYLDSETGIGGTDLVDQDDSELVYYRQGTDFAPGPVSRVVPGSTVLLEGRWVYGVPEDDGFSSASLISSDARFAPIDLPVRYQELGNRAVVVVIPTDLPAGFTDAPASLEVSTGSYSGDGIHVRDTSWTGQVVFAAAQSSTTSLALERRFGTSRERLSASAVVATSSAAVAHGTVDFYLNQKLIGSAPVDASGRASVVLPRLPRGKHFVTAAFRGTDVVATSSSAASSIRVLF